METEKEIWINFRKDQKRKVKIVFQHMDTLKRLKKAAFQLSNMIYLSCNSTHKFHEENKKKLRRVRRLIAKYKNLDCAVNVKSSPFDLSSSTEIACVCAKYNSNSSRFKSMLIALKPPTQESEEEYKSMVPLMNQNKIHLFDGIMNHNIFYPPMRTTSASSPCSSTVTGNNCGMEPLLKKLNDISIQDMDIA